MFKTPLKKYLKRRIKLGCRVTVETADGTELSNNAIVTAISECGNYIQTSLGLSYLPKEQIKRV